MTDKKHRGIDAKINECMWEFTTYAARVAPPIAIFESVRPAFSTGRPLMLALREMLEERTGHRYDLHHVYHNAYELGGAAQRPRYFWVASRLPFGVRYPDVTSPSMHEVIGDLAGLSCTWEEQPYRRPASWWSTTPRERTVTVDGHVWEATPNTMRALDLLELNDGEWPPGWHIGRMAKYLWETKGKLPDSWTDRVDKLLAKDFNMGFTTLTRWNDANPARVITGGALGLVLHPWEPRTITHREAARIMGFPDDWRILPLKRRTGLGATWGKGITTQCGHWIATQAMNALDGRPAENAGHLIGDREWLHGADASVARKTETVELPDSIAS